MIVGAEMIADEETIVDEEMIVVLTTEKGESIKIINRVDQDKNHILKAKTAQKSMIENIMLTEREVEVEVGN